MVTKEAAVKKMGAGEFKAKCLAVLDSVAREREAVYVTKRGKLVAVVVPPEDGDGDVAQSLLGSVIAEGDIVGSVDESWEADR